MKGFVTVILFFLFALAFAGTEYVDAVPAASMTVCTVQHTDTTPQHSINEDRVIPLDSNKGIADMEFGDAHTLAHRVSASAERMYRFSSMETTQFIKICCVRWPPGWPVLQAVIPMCMPLPIPFPGIVLASTISLV